MTTAPGTVIHFKDFKEVDDPTNPVADSQKTYELATSGGPY